MKQLILRNGMTSYLDDEDYDKFSKFDWGVIKNIHGENYYVRRTRQVGSGRSEIVLMHREIMGIDDSKIFIDHQNGNGLDNRKSNLRIATHSQNMANRKKHINNTSGYVGVVRCRGKWRSYVQYKGKVFYGGDFCSKKEAAISRDKKAKELFGEFARLNFN